MFDNYQAYFNKAITGKSTIEMLKAQHEETINSYAELSKELKDLISKEHNYELAVDLLKKLV